MSQGEQGDKPDRAGDSDYFGSGYFEGKTSNYVVPGVEGGYNAYANRGFWADTIAKIKKYEPNLEGKKVFDLGSAYGYLLNWLKDEYKGQQVQFIGGDISLPALQRSRELAKVAASEGDETTPAVGLVQLNVDEERKKEGASRLPFADGSLRVVTALDVVEHTHNFTGTISEIARVLEPGGLFVIGVPITDTLEGKVWKHLDKDSSHVSKPTREELMDALKTAGFTVLDSKYYFPLPGKKIPFPRTNMEVVCQKLTVEQQAERLKEAAQRAPLAQPEQSAQPEDLTQH
jgi:SAM-dependent methyltransferase